MSSVQGNSYFTGVVNQAVSLPTLNVGTLNASTTITSVLKPDTVIGAVGSISSVTTLDATRSGVLTVVTGGAYAITLPAASASTGYVYNLVLGALPSAAIGVAVTGSDNMYGNVSCSQALASAVGLPILGFSVVKFEPAAGQGDSLKFSCDGTDWYVDGAMQRTGTITGA